MLATAATIVVAAYLCAGLLLLGPRNPGYSHARHTISEIGEVGARDQRLVAVGLFLPVGLCLLFVASLVRPASAPAAALALCIAIGYIGAAAFPCDRGSPLSGTPRQAMHNLAGAIEYIGGGFALLTLARELGQPFKIAGIIVLGVAVGLSVVPAGAGRGILQRVAEACLFGGLALAAWRLAAAA